EFVTAIDSVCTDGTSLKPTIILKAEEWTDEKMAIDCLRRNFVKKSITAQKARDEYRLLLFDRHSSPVNMKFLDFYISQKIVPYCLPLHTTYRL
ncbi:hypothetical protein C7212DRAFT_169593, partial [Tuber magnatum]